MKATKGSQQLGLEKFRVASLQHTDKITGGSKGDDIDTIQPVSSYACRRPTVQPTQQDE